MNWALMDLESNPRPLYTETGRPEAEGLTASNNNSETRARIQAYTSLNEKTMPKPLPPWSSQVKKAT